MIPFLGRSPLQGAAVSSLGYLLGGNGKAVSAVPGQAKAPEVGAERAQLSVFCSPPISVLNAPSGVTEAPTGAGAYAVKFRIQKAKLFRFWS